MTVPVGAAAQAIGVICAVNVIDWPKADGLTEEARVVVLAFWVTFCVRTADVLPL